MVPLSTEKVVFFWFEVSSAHPPRSGEGVPGALLIFLEENILTYQPANDRTIRKSMSDSSDAEQVICDYVNTCAIFRDKQLTVTPETLFLIEEVFRQNDNLKTGLPGRPKKIRIILRNRIRELKRGDSSSKRLPNASSSVSCSELDTASKGARIEEDPVRCFYRILELCPSRDIMYKCWPSLSRTSGILSCSRRVVEEHSYHLIHKCMFVST